MNDTKQTPKKQTSKIADVLANEFEQSNTIMGVAPSALCRALGRYSWENDQIISVISFIGGGSTIMTRKAMTGHARMGRTGNENYGPIPSLSREDRATLECLAVIAQ